MTWKLVLYLKQNRDWNGQISQCLCTTTDKLKINRCGMILQDKTIDINRFYNKEEEYQFMQNDSTR